MLGRNVSASAVMALAGVVIVVLLALAVSTRVSEPFDRAVMNAVRSDALHQVLSPLRWITELGSTGAVTVMAIVAILVGVLIGLSRVWLGVHYPTDVLAGWTAGATIVLVYARLTRSVSPEPAAAAVDVDPAAQRSDPPAPG